MMAGGRWPAPPDATHASPVDGSATATGRASIGRSAPSRSKAWTRWVRELVLVAGLYAAYMAARALIGIHIDDAEARGLDILDLEAAFALDIERPLNALVTAIPPLGLLAAYLYATLHYVATPAMLVWMAVRRRGAYKVERNALLIATAIGLLGYWLLPTAPPRLVDAGLTDTMAAFSDLGWWGGAASAPRGMESLSNQYAAMPSLHVGWAVWVAACLAAHAPRRLVRRWAWIYPAVMALVVMATANHYLLDVVAGTGCAVLGVLLARSRADHQ
jgi:PAP2 superfamily